MYGWRVLGRLVGVDGDRYGEADVSFVFDVGSAYRLSFIGMSRSVRVRVCGGWVLHLFDTRNISTLRSKLSIVLS